MELLVQGANVKTHTTVFTLFKDFDSIGRSEYPYGKYSCEQAPVVPPVLPLLQYRHKPDGPGVLIRSMIDWLRKRTRACTMLVMWGM